MIRKLLSLFLGVVAIGSASAADFSAAENAVRNLEVAYDKKDIEAAVAAKDFSAEAKLMMQKLNPQLSSDQDILKKTAEVLELSFRKEIREKGFPDFTKLKCSFSKQRFDSPDLVKLTETCVFPDGKKSVQDLHVFKSDKGWRVVNVPQ